MGGVWFIAAAYAVGLLSFPGLGRLHIRPIVQQDEVVATTRAIELNLRGLSQLGTLTYWEALGPRLALLLVALDIAKGWLPLVVGRLIHISESHLILAAAALVAGHCCAPPKFVVSRGTAVALGTLVAVQPLIALGGGLSWCLAMELGESVALSLMVATVTAIGLATYLEPFSPSFWYTVAVAILMVSMHRYHLCDFWRGAEPRVNLLRPRLSAGLRQTHIPGSMTSYRVCEQDPKLHPPKGGAHDWGFFGHPWSIQDLLLFSPNVSDDLRGKIERNELSAKELENFLRLIIGAARVIGEGVISARGRTAYGAIAITGWLPEEFNNPAKRKKIEAFLASGIKKTFRVIGATNVGLGALTSPVTKQGQTLEEKGLGPVTSGNSLTAGSCVRGVLKACRLMSIDPAKATVAIIGASGSVGYPATRRLASKFAKTIIVARDAVKLQTVQRRLKDEVSGQVEATTDVAQALSQADVVLIAVTTPLELPTDCFKPGSVVMCASIPTVLTPELLRERPDVLFFQGGVWRFPGRTSAWRQLRMGGASYTYACMLETMLRALDGETTSGGIGLTVDVAEMDRMLERADYYGCHLAGFRVLGRRIGYLQLISIRLAAALKKLKSRS